MPRMTFTALFLTSLTLAACGPSDEILQGRVDEAVAFKEWSSWLDASVTKGQLTLEGLAPDEASLQEVAILSQVQGIKGVTNNVALDTALVRRRTQASDCTRAVDAALAERPVRFTSGAARLQAASNRTLDQIAQTLATCPDAAFEVRGQLAEGATANAALSERRTRAVVDYLVGKGVAAERLTAMPAGGSVIVLTLAPR